MRRVSWGQSAQTTTSHPDIVFCPWYRFLSLISFFVPDIVFCPWYRFVPDIGHKFWSLNIVFSLMGLNLLEENRNGKTTRKTVFIITFKLIFCC